MYIKLVKVNNNFSSTFSLTFKKKLTFLTQFGLGFIHYFKTDVNVNLYD